MLLYMIKVRDFSRIIALLTSPLCTKLISTFDLPIASIMPELGFTTKQRGWVVRILNTMFLVGELLIISNCEILAPFIKAM